MIRPQGKNGFLLRVVSLFLIFVFFMFWSSSDRDFPHDEQRDELSEDETTGNDSLEQVQNVHDPGKNQKNNSSGMEEKEDSDTVVFKKFELSSPELETFYQRRSEPREITVAISGLKIDKELFKVKTVDELPKALTIPLPEGRVKKFHSQFIHFRDNNSFTWFGVFEDNETETIHLSSHNLSIVGQLNTKEGLYEIKHLSEDKNIIREIDTKKYREDSNDGVIVDEDSLASSSRKNSSKKAIVKRRDQKNNSLIKGQVENSPLDIKNSSKKIKRSPTRADKSSNQKKLKRSPNQSEQPDIEMVTVDIIVGYSQLIKESEGGEDAAIALINSFVDAANTVHRNSRTGVFLQVVERVELNVRTSPKGFSENLSQMQAAYSVVTGEQEYDPQNPYHVLIKRRHEVQADLAILITETYLTLSVEKTEEKQGRMTVIKTLPIRSCGRSYILDQRFTNPIQFRSFGVSVVGANCDLHNFVHENGHSFSGGHDKESSPGDQFSSNYVPYAVGFRSPGNFRTVMSYPCNQVQCERIPYFSDPTQDVQGLYIGEPNEKDNARAIRERAAFVSRIYEGEVSLEQ